MANIEKLVKEKQGRILIVETSSLPEYETTRGFYKKINYTHEATIREFYSSGEDKIVFWKRLVL
jgi:ribosomal protein S18 acetylase RimI-like enzyme